MKRIREWCEYGGGGDIPLCRTKQDEIYIIFKKKGVNVIKGG